MSKKEILEKLPEGWKYAENNEFVHVRNGNGTAMIQGITRHILKIFHLKKKSIRKYDRFFILLYK
ncbi:hypothetical protein N3930_23840 [Bacillus thuringiensis]|nr:hypothetical protein [Bacillus thuringiensis]